MEDSGRFITGAGLPIWDIAARTLSHRFPNFNFGHSSKSFLSMTVFIAESPHGFFKHDPHSCLMPLGHQSLKLTTHQENDTLSDLSDLSWHRHLRQNQTDLINLVKAMYLSKQDPNACHKAIKTLTDQPYTRH